MSAAGALTTEIGELLLADPRASDRLNAVPPFLELALVLVAALLLVWRPRWLGDTLRRAWHALARRGHRHAVLASACAAVGLSAATMAWHGFPLPRVPDENGHLLIADTLAAGRLTNPTPRVPAAFEEVTVLVRPTYTAKYPPAPGAVLALGQLLGHPGVGLCLTAGLLAATCCWFLRGWLPAPWALVGTALLTLRVGLGSYWGQSYWGGGVAAAGAMLLYGALPRLVQRPRKLLWLPLALGLFLLANSRPLEGALAALPAAVVLASSLPSRWRRLGPAMALLAVALATGAGATAIYNRAVTGQALRHPYQVHHATYAYPVEVFVPFASPPAPVRYSSPALAASFQRLARGAESWSEALRNAAGHFARMAYFVCGLPLLAGAAFALSRLPSRATRTRWQLFALLCSALPAGLYASSGWWFPHYSATAAGPLLLLGLLGLREAAAGTKRGRRLGPWLAAAALIVQVPLTVAQVSLLRRHPDPVSRFRQRVEAHFAQRGERALVVVDDRLRASREWIFNRADLERAPVLWIQDLGPGVTRRVADAYAPRTLHRLLPAGRGPLPRLQRVP